jgi:enhancer of mRNA-decapping protein 4
VKVWGGKRRSPISEFTAHDGDAVTSIAFLSNQENTFLLTAGPLNRVVKLWAPESGAPLTRRSSIVWQCIQTLQFESSNSGAKLEDLFFNQVAIACQSSLLIIANAKQNAIYVIHVEFGTNPATAKMTYISEFSVYTPILSFVVTEDKVTEDGDGYLQVYCIQPQAVQVYPLQVSQCYPLLTEDLKAVTSAARAKDSPSGDVQKGVNNGITKVVSSGPPAGSNPNAAGQDPSGLGGFPERADRRDLIDVTTEVVKATESGGKGSGVLTGSREVMDFGTKLAYQSTQLTQPLTERVMPSSTVPTSQRILQTEHGLDTPSSWQQQSSPLESPAKEQRYIPVSSGTSQLHSVKLLDKSAASTDTLVEDNLLEKDSREAPVDPAPPVQQHTKPNSTTTTKTGTSKPNKYEFETRSQLAGKMSDGNGGGPLPPHFLTPSHLMSLVEGQAKPSDAADMQELSRTQEKEMASSATLKAMKTTEFESSETNLGHAVDFNLEAEEELETLDQSELSVEAGSTDIFNDASSDSVDRQDTLTTSKFELLESYMKDEAQKAEEAGLLDEIGQPLLAKDQSREKMVNVTDDSPRIPMGAQGKNRNKNKTTGSSGITGVPGLTTSAQIPGVSSFPEAPSVGSNSSVVDFGAQITVMQESLNQLITMQNDLQKQVSVMVAVPVSKEGKRIEGALGQRMEKVLKAHVDAMWARVAEENAKREKSEKERVQQVNTLLSNLVSKDMPNALERGFKKEFVALGPTITQAVLPPLQKAISTVVMETFQKGITEKVVPQLEKVVGVKLEATLARQLQVQFHTVGKQALQETLRACLESTLLPAFERSCQVMFEQIDTTFANNMANHTSDTQQQFAASHTALASTLKVRPWCLLLFQISLNPKPYNLNPGHSSLYHVKI